MTGVYECMHVCLYDRAEDHGWGAGRTVLVVLG